LRPALANRAPQIDDEILHVLIAVGRIFLERLVDDRAHRIGNARRQRRRRPVRDRLQQLEIVRGLERPPASERFVEHDAEREHVRTLV